MKIDSVVSHQYSSQRVEPENSIESSNGSASFSSILNTKTAQTGSTDSSKSNDFNQADFTRMTRQEMFDWMNEQIRTEKMSLDESSPFLGMTMKVSVATGQPVDMAVDTRRVNYIEKARSGIEWAQHNHDADLAKQLQNAIDIMYRNQEKIRG